MTLDLHVHTAVGSLDSSIQPAMLVNALCEEGVDGAVITEHLAPWPEQLGEEAASAGHLLIGGIELAFGRDHLLVFGAPWLSRTTARALRTAESASAAAEMARATGGLMTVLAHPFRYHRERWPVADPVRSVAERDLLDNVDAVEVLNGGCTDEENLMAFEVARLRGLPATAGSDAHYTHAVGYAVTHLPHRVTSAADVVEMILGGSHDVQTRGERRKRGTAQWGGRDVPRTV